jgi:hypothetical protein
MNYSDNYDNLSEKELENLIEEKEKIIKEKFQSHFTLNLEDVRGISFKTHFWDFICSKNNRNEWIGRGDFRDKVKTISYLWNVQTKCFESAQDHGYSVNNIGSTIYNILFKNSSRTEKENRYFIMTDISEFLNYIGMISTTEDSEND